MKRIAVFCGSSEGTDKTILTQAEQLGRTLAKQHISLVYGGARIGVMGIVAQACLDNHGNVIGVIPEFLMRKEVVHKALSNLIITETMHERKLKMHDLSDGFMALPGGFGTFEELFEIITWAQLGLHQKPIGILNCNGFYDYLIKMFETLVSKGFLKKSNLDLIVIDDTIQGLLSQMRSYKPRSIPKWLKVERT